MKVFIDIETLFEGTTKKASSPFTIDLNSQSATITVADIKTEARKHFKENDFTNRIVSEKVKFAGQDNYEDSVDIIAIAGHCPKIKYTVEITLPEVSAKLNSPIAKNLSNTKKSISKPSRKQEKKID